MEHSSLHNLLSRNLSGVYRDPRRILSDTETLLNSPLGRHLHPTAQPLTSNDGTVTPSVLMLQGILPMVYRNVTYNVPIDVYLPAPYPACPPTVYVRPVSTMAIKANHRHVGMDGRVYMPYLHEWRANTHNLSELAVWMSSLFGSEPPCYAKPSPAPPSTPSIPYSSKKENEEQERIRLQQLEKEIAEANLAAKVAREESLKEAQLKAEQIKLQKEHEQQLSYMRFMATSKVQYELQMKFRNAKDDLHETLKNQKLLDYGRNEIQQLIMEAEERKEELIALNDEMDAEVKRLEQWLEEAADKLIPKPNLQQQKEGNADDNNHSSTQSSNNSKNVDLIALPIDTHSSQMLQLAAENAAIDDCIYVLDQSMGRGNMPLEVFRKEVRRLSTRQFMVKAHFLMKMQILGD